MLLEQPFLFWGTSFSPLRGKRNKCWENHYPPLSPGVFHPLPTQKLSVAGPRWSVRRGNLFPPRTIPNSQNPGADSINKLSSQWQNSKWTELSEKFPLTPVKTLHLLSFLLPQGHFLSTSLYMNPPPSSFPRSSTLCSRLELLPVWYRHGTRCGLFPLAFSTAG